MSMSNWPRWYKARCRECAWATVAHNIVTCRKDMWHCKIMLRDIDKPPVYASRCSAYEPMDLEPDGQPIAGADYPDRDK